MPADLQASVHRENTKPRNIDYVFLNIYYFITKCCLSGCFLKMKWQIDDDVPGYFEERDEENRS